MLRKRPSENIKLDRIFYRASMATYNAVERTVKFPDKISDGKKILIRRGDPYITSNMEEVRFLSNLRFIKVRRASDEEVKIWMYHPENLPHIMKDISDRPDIVEKFKWTPSDEGYIINVLKRRGYTVESATNRGNPDSKAEKEIARAIKLLENDGYTITKKVELEPEPTEEVVEDNKTVEIEVELDPKEEDGIKVYTKKELKGMTRKELIDLARPFGIKIVRVKTQEVLDNLVKEYAKYDSNGILRKTSKQS